MKRGRGGRFEFCERRREERRTLVERKAATSAVRSVELDNDERAESYDGAHLKL